MLNVSLPSDKLSILNCWAFSERILFPLSTITIPRSPLTSLLHGRNGLKPVEFPLVLAPQASLMVTTRGTSNWSFTTCKSYYQKSTSSSSKIVINFLEISETLTCSQMWSITTGNRSGSSTIFTGLIQPLLSKNTTPIYTSNYLPPQCPNNFCSGLRSIYHFQIPHY